MVGVADIIVDGILFLIIFVVLVFMIIGLFNLGEVGSKPITLSSGVLYTLLLTMVFFGLIKFYQYSKSKILRKQSEKVKM